MIGIIHLFLVKFIRSGLGRVDLDFMLGMNKGLMETGDMKGFVRFGSFRCLPSTLNAFSYLRFYFGSLTFG